MWESESERFGDMEAEWEAFLQLAQDTNDFEWEDGT
jgi:hypothetical protein